MKIKEFLKKLEEANSFLKSLKLNTYYLEDTTFYGSDPVYNYEDYTKYMSKVYNEEYIKLCENVEVEINNHHIILDATNDSYDFVDNSLIFEVRKSGR